MDAGTRGCVGRITAARAQRTTSLVRRDAATRQTEIVSLSKTFPSIVVKKMKVCYGTAQNALDDACAADGTQRRRGLRPKPRDALLCVCLFSLFVK